MLSSVLGMQYPWIGNCQLQGYTYEQNSLESYCVFNENSKCNAEEFYNGTCGQEYIKEITCGKLNERVHPQLQACCNGLEKFHYPGQKGGSDLCREPLGFFSSMWEKTVFFFSGNYF